MFNRLTHVIVCVLLMHNLAADSVPVTETVANQSIDAVQIPTLVRIDDQRIAKRQAHWHYVFEKKQLKKDIAYGIVGAAMGVVMVSLISSWYKNRIGPKKISILDDQNYSQSAKDRYEAKINEEALREWLYRQSLSGRVNWIAGKALEAVIYSCITALCTRYVTKSGTFLEKIFNTFLSFDCKDPFVPLASKLLRDTTLWHNSLVSFIKESSDVKGDDDLTKKLRIQMARDVLVDHTAFVYALEDCIAYMQEFLVDNESLTSDAAEQLHNHFYELSMLANDIIAREEAVVADLSVGNKSQASQSLLHTIQGLYNEFDRAIKTMGAILYGNDFSLPCAAVRT
jgi:hypothetical protein